MNFEISSTDKSLLQTIKRKIDSKTKPLGSLGQLETIAEQLCLIQNTTEPKLLNPTIVVFAADHGIARQGVSAYPQEVTYQMVMNFLNGGAAINSFCKANDIELKIVDAGVNFKFDDTPGLIRKKVGSGTQNCLVQQAITSMQYDEALKTGAQIVDEIHNENTNIVGFGEMGIGNTSSASLIMSYVCNLPIDICVGRGTGLDNAGLAAKIKTLQAVRQHHGELSSIPDIIQAVGGFEIAMMMGAMMRAAELRMAILVDGFISSAAFLATHAMHLEIMDYAIFSHCSDESGHKIMLDQIKANPILNLKLRLGEGTGCALAYPIIKSAISFLHDMASFDSAGVSTDK